MSPLLLLLHLHPHLAIWQWLQLLTSLHHPCSSYPVTLTSDPFPFSSPTQLYDCPAKSKHTQHTQRRTQGQFLPPLLGIRCPPLPGPRLLPLIETPSLLLASLSSSSPSLPTCQLLAQAGQGEGLITGTEGGVLPPFKLLPPSPSFIFTCGSISSNYSVRR